jgi:cell division transport system permease protein
MMRVDWCCIRDGCTSMTDVRSDEEDYAAGDLPAPETLPDQELPRIETPIVPKSTIGGRAVVAMVAIMSFLASLAMGAVIMVRAAASDWQSDVASEVTIQVRPVAGRDVDSDVAKAVIVARSLAGIADVRPYSKEESARLLEPWLGSGLALGDLPVPRVIAVSLGRDPAPDLLQLRQALAEQVPAASLDDHREFVERMRGVTNGALAAGIGVLLLVLAATVLAVTFATRGAMATNRPVIEVLHFVGAKNSFIAGHFQRHFLALGLRGGVIGGGCAALLFALVQLGGAWFRGSSGGEQLIALFGAMSIGWQGYAAVVGLVMLIAMVTAATSRHTVNRTLETIQ